LDRKESVSEISHKEIMIERIKGLIAQGEGLKVEFKTAEGGIPKSVYETVCSFANTRGGEILLGVDDKGNITGIDKDKVVQFKKDFSNEINNPKKNYPPLYLSIENYEIDKKEILYICVQETSMVQRCDGKIYVRNQDGDYDATDQQTNVAKLYSRKESSYSESQIFPYVTLEDLRVDLLARARKMASFQREGHPWNELDDLTLLKSTALYKKDFITNQEGFTLACILLFGKDEVIASVLPHFKTDLILRVGNKDRYDDRDDVRTNLIESYDRILTFIAKYLPSPFFLEGIVRIDIRNAIFREVAANLLMHREYLNRFPAKFVIEENLIYAENGNKPYMRHRTLTPETSIPLTKNPTVARIFKEIGLAEELGSGIRKIFQYGETYAGHVPVLTESDIFRFELKTNWVSFQSAPQVSPQAEGLKTEQTTDTSLGRKQSAPQVSPQAEGLKTEQTTDTSLGRKQSHPQATSQVEKNILEFCTTSKTLREITDYTGFKDIKHFRRKHLLPLIKQGLLVLTQPDKPTSPLQKYLKSSV
jgi:ATP-dependent DNA helicase RecG